MTTPSLATRFCGLEFATPLVLLSGCVGFGEEYTRVEGFSNRDAGAICLKGTTGTRVSAMRPTASPRPWDGMLNAIGLQNPGVDKVVREILRRWTSPRRAHRNACGSTIEEYVEVHAALRRFAHRPRSEINISCPNVKEGACSSATCRRCRRAWSPPAAR